MSVNELLQQIMGSAIIAILGAGGIIGVCIVVIMLYSFLRGLV